MSMIKSKKHIGVYQKLLENGDISYYYNYKDVDGKKVWRCVGKKSNGFSEKDALMQRRKALAEVSFSDEPLYVKQRKQKEVITIRKLAEKYFNEKKDIKNHRDAYLKYVNKIDGKFGDKNVLHLKADDVESFKKWLVKDGYRNASVNYYLSQLRAIINYAIDKEVINISNPCSKVKLLPLDNARQRILSENEIELLLGSMIHKPKAYLFVLIAILTGARPQAILNVKRKDVDIGYDKISFMEMKKNRKYSVGVHEKLQLTLYDWIKGLQPEEYLFYRENPRLDKSKHISYISIKNMIHPIMDKLFNQGLEPNDRINRVTLYTLRHSFGSLLSAKGANAFVIKDLMNHSTINMTDRYIKVPDIEAKKYIDAIF
ncbi:tyrosine-type recombinase/integrase [Aliarcobacter butzleri]|uniref:tyrosine-type recombinase/integrase n=2 Tax=Arcobacteraceae TaxID=2808963 RepID=UPI001EDBBFA7|nr:site-specific integrase [Aliarcobacter butzleri]MCG3662683.1 tyrosine-type recombinase/integrase [Aliarcobacter butzleri]